MTISVWRYSHLTLAIFSFLFVLLASITGIILAFEPISKALTPYCVNDLQNISLAHTLEILNENYDEVFEFTITPNDFVELDAIDKDGRSLKGYIDPKTGAFLGKPIIKSKLFRVTTNLHRSLFLKSTGRIWVGITSFLLFLIVISGLILIVKRQLKVKYFFSKVIKDHFSQYWHIILGRWFLIPIVIVTLTGVFLSLYRFNVLPKTKGEKEVYVQDIKSMPKVNPINFKAFKGINLHQVRSIEFPFSKDVEDFYIINLLETSLEVNQYTGELISKRPESYLTALTALSIKLHTGQGSLIWSIILGISCVVILFFMYSGFLMTVNRRKKRHKVKSISHQDQAEYIILVGSETGHTYQFATAFYKALVKAGQLVYMTELNAYSLYKNAKHIIVFTSTYGDGEPPINAKKFKKQFKANDKVNTLSFSVLGFGSKAYQQYCQFAIDIQELFKKETNWEETIPLGKVNNQSIADFKTWIDSWCNTTGIMLDIELPKQEKNIKKVKDFRVVSISPDLHIDDTFLLRLKPLKKVKFKSGDLLGFRPKEDMVERLYSVGKIDNDILLSIKKHEFGLCSTYLWSQKVANIISGELKKHKAFHFPKRAKEVVLISNGTGIAPFLGMLNDNKKQIKTHLFWGGRTKQSLELYKDIIDQNLLNGHLTGFYTAFSQEQKEKIYVQDTIKQYQDIIINAVKNKGVIMICGSIAMQKQVYLILDQILQSQFQITVKALESKGQIKTDCY